MTAYIARRIFLMLPTLLGILFVSFVVVQFAPGGPVERVIAQLSGADTGGTSRISGAAGGDFGARAQVGASADAVNSKYRGAQGLDPDFIKSLEKQFGFDKPAPERFALMLWNFARFDFGKSYFRDVSVLQLIKEKLPVSDRKSTRLNSSHSSISYAVFCLKKKTPVPTFTITEAYP